MAVALQKVGKTEVIIDNLRRIKLINQQAKCVEAVLGDITEITGGKDPL